MLISLQTSRFRQIIQVEVFASLFLWEMQILFKKKRVQNVNTCTSSAPKFLEIVCKKLTWFHYIFIQKVHARKNITTN